MKRALLALCLAASFVLPVSAQQPKPKPAPKAKPAPTQPQLSPEQEKGLQLLEAAHAQANGLEPAMRAYALIQIAQGYKKFNPKKSAALMEEAFQATLTIEDRKENERARNLLQERILTELFRTNPDRVEEALNQVAKPVKARLIERVVTYLVNKKNYDRAFEMLRDLNDVEMPYSAAAELMANLPVERNPDKLTLFAAALRSYRNNAERHKGGFFSNDLSSIVMRFNRELPQGQVMEAIEEILNQARESDKGDDRVSMSVGGDKGSASFNSFYDFRLFQLYPVVREIDNGRADRLLSESNQLRSMFEKYPDGMGSIDPGSMMPRRPEAQSGGTSFSVNMSPKNEPPEANREDELAAQYRQRVSAAVREAQTNPKQALASALALPEQLGQGASPRAEALLEIARVTLKSAPSISKQALDELLKIKIDSTGGLRIVMVGQSLSQAGNLYLKLGENDAVFNVVSQGFKLAEAAYVKDTDHDKPNEALKAFWPSTSLWREFIQLAAKASPAKAAELVGEVKDDDIRTLQHIALADALLGVRFASMPTIMQRGNSISMMSSDSDDEDEGGGDQRAVSQSQSRD